MRLILLLMGIEPSDINESSEAFLAEMGIEEGDGILILSLEILRAAEEPNRPIV